MRAELISLRSRAEGKQSSERLTTSSLWRNTSTLESLISFSRWGSEWIFSVCFLKTWLSVCLSMRAINRRTVTMSLSPSCRNWLGCYLSWKAAWGDRPETSITWRAVQSQRVGSDSSTQHKVWITAWAPCSYTINSLQFAAGCQIQSVNCMLSLRNAVVEQVKHKLKLPLEHTEADDVYNYYQVWFLTLKSEF